MAVSSAKVTSRSTYSGANPSASVSSVTVGRLRSGNTSTGRLRKVMAPYTSRMRAAPSTNKRLRRLAVMRKLNIRRPDVLADLVEQGGAFGDHAQIGFEACQHDD